MKIAILGFGDQGKSAYEYWSQQGHDITIRDSRTDIPVPSGIQARLGEDYLHDLDGFDLVVRAAPSIHPRDIVAANTPEVLQKVTTNTNEFLRVCPSKNVIGVTGSKGKGTTSSLIAKMLEAAGLHAHLGGNIGIPPLDMLKNDIAPTDWVVLELANFQLIDIHYSPHIGICLMMVPEHMNWHKDMDEYVTAKSQLFKNQMEDDIAIYFANNEYSKRVVAPGNGRKLPYFAAPGAEVINGNITIGGQTICATHELKLLGEHNWQNACAAVTAVWQVTQDIGAIRSVLTTFSGLEHRLEFVREFDGVKYFNDSYGTTPETAIVAVQAFREPKVVILGGSDKGAQFNELAKVVASTNVRAVILIGDTAPQIEKALRENDFTAITPGSTTMPEIVAAAKNAAQPGDIVLLSTGCASFGLFANYKDRGNQFKQVVQQL